MARRLAVVALLALLLTGGAASGSSVTDRQRAIQDKIERLQDRVAVANEKEEVLTSQISAVTSKIRALEADVASATSRLHTIEGELAVHRNRLAKLTQLFHYQTQHMLLLRRQFAVAERRLHARLVAIYREDDPTTVDVVLAARSFSDLLDQLDYLDTLNAQDTSIARQVAASRDQVTKARGKTNRTRKQVNAAKRTLEARLEEELAERSRLISAQTELAGARQAKQRTLSSVQASEKEFLHEIEGLEQASRELAARIQAAQSASAQYASPSGTPSAAGMVWPVAGPVTSTFGWRWGRMHEGIDIGAPSGAAIQASAGGTVIYAGWMSGYGNLVVVDHGGGLATAYAHMSSIGTGIGAGVSRGQVIGYVGCTGHCYGSHLHFEVRINGGAVDPLGYL